MKINHYLTFSGPAFVPTSTDETSARETAGAVTADIGVSLYDQITNLAAVNINDVEDRF